MATAPSVFKNSHFLVTWNNLQKKCSEVEGLEILVDIVSYRTGDDKIQNRHDVPGTAELPNVILRRPLTADTEFYTWIQSVVTGTYVPTDVIITLLDDSLNPALKWTLRNAWPCRLSYSPLNADDGTIIYEELELTHFGLELVAG